LSNYPFESRVLKEQPSKTSRTILLVANSNGQVMCDACIVPRCTRAVVSYSFKRS